MKKIFFLIYFLFNSFQIILTLKIKNNKNNKNNIFFNNQIESFFRNNLQEKKKLNLKENEFFPSLILSLPDNLLDGKWLNQWTIGNGKFGSLVGGSISGDIIPLSIADFYVIEGYKKQQNKINQVSKDQQFKKARDSLILGNFKDAQSSLSSLTSQTPLGMFQYICDLMFIVNPIPILLATSSTSSSSQFNQNRRSQAIGRDKIWKDFNQLFTTQSFGKSLQSTNTLDVKFGIVKQIFISQPLKSIPNLNTNLPISSHYTYSRAWYASSVDDVIVGKFKCRPKYPSQNITTTTSLINDNCLHFGLKLNRHMNRNGLLMPETGWNIQTFSNIINKYQLDKSNPQNERKFDTKTISNEQIIAIDLSLQSTPDIHHSGAEMCAIVICTSSSLNENDQSTDLKFSNDPTNPKYFICNKASEAHIILSIQSTNYNPNDQVEETRKKCWKTINNAINLGPDQLRKRHIQSFSKHMSNTEIFIGEENSYNETEGYHITKLIQSFRETSSPPKKLMNSLLTSSYWYNKYLLLSSSSRSVSNLQGIWADGPHNQWNSDYHLNINIQMTYWPAYTYGIHSQVIPPLLDFIKRLAKSGEKTAKELYNCQGWVAHGFTDNLLDVGIRGGLEWALCVTCGSWLALHLWDHLTYTTFSLEFLLDIFFPVYRSMVLFYLDYLFIGPDGNYHTGPTTSPENSYIAKDSAKKVNHILTFSPGIDMSVLRQVVNSYSIAIQWTYHHLDTNNTISSDQINLIKKQLTEDEKIVNKLSSMVKKMKNSANPIVDSINKQILEYPTTGFPLGKDNSYKITVSEDLDRGHRHFSGFHWLYPGMFIPGNQTYDTLMDIARITLEKKINSGGGHTGWSASWESCLWGRLRNGDNAVKALKKILDKYLSKNLLGLHPKLLPNIQSCVTCYGAVPPNQISAGDTTSRGMTTADSSVFQIDANSGLSSGLTEILFQSHIPTLLLFLPALSSKIPSGSVKNLLSRGNFNVDFQWKQNKITEIFIKIDSWHPWFIPQYQSEIGYYSTDYSTTKYNKNNNFKNYLTLIIPNHLTISKITSSSLPSLLSTTTTITTITTNADLCAEAIIRPKNTIPNHIHQSSDSYVHFLINSYPCHILLEDK